MISVTLLLKMLHKEGLLHWANKIGLEGISLSDYRKKSTKDGINKHSEIEKYLKYGTKFNESDKLDKCLIGYKILSIEQNISNGFINGRIDLVIGKNNKKIVIDFKSNKKIYLEHKLQLSSYKEIYKADEIGIIDFNKWELNIIKIDSKKYFEIVKRLYQINELLIQLNEKI